MKSKFIIIVFCSIAISLKAQNNLDQYLKSAKDLEFIPLDFTKGFFTNTLGQLNTANIRYNCKIAWPERQENNQVFTLNSKIASFYVPQSNGDTLFFKNGYPNIIKNDEFTFYQILNDGHYKLLDKININKASHRVW